MSILKINNLNYRYNQKRALTNFSLEVEKGSWISLVGPNGCGKTTLVKILAGLIKTPCDIEVDGMKIDDKNINKIRGRIGFVFNDSADVFVGETVMDDLAFGLENLNLKKEEIIRRINNVAKLFDLESILNKNPQRLSGGEKQKVALAAILVMNAKILILDDSLNMIDPFEKREILKILKELHQKTDLTIITTASTLEDVLYSDKIVVMNYGVKVVEGKTLEVLKEEPIFIELKMRLPFMIDLSLKLKDYELVDDVVLNMKDMVNKLWE